uniref:serine/threonine-protein kinase PLK4-like isoform X1 n=2 Tax=Ciona intestinalis TaxID=7719 RepID=UPI00089DAE23|nr:serine/threonine-protein kinase PLK4-like isoform X1 [Ciona intestinalis]|eukprot:XP_018670432.1 serine/threonine-protein kinase PLK4-like isoform X1 [Ciona intestinalis]
MRLPFLKDVKNLLEFTFSRSNLVSILFFIYTMPHKVAKKLYNSHSDQMPPYGSTIAEYEVLNLIGRGAFACVYRAKCRQSNRGVAIKMIDKRSMRKSGMVSRVRSEVEIHAQLKHPSILELHHCFEDADHVYLILELCMKGELNRFLKSQGNSLCEQQVREFMVQIVEGMLYLHAHGILHRDITLANMLLDDNCHIKIADFGLATRLALPTDKHFTMCGTPNFISPEIATRSAHGLESDVWSLGCMFYTFLVGVPPFDTDAVKSTLNRVVLGNFTIPENISQQASDLITKMLRKDPQDRISLSAVLDHPFMKPDTLKGREASVDSGHATMTTNSTNNYSRQGTLHHQQPSFTESRRQPPRTRPIVALPPQKLEPVLDIGSTYEESYDERRPAAKNGFGRPENTDTRRQWASRTRDMPGNRPPMWRQPEDRGENPHDVRHVHGDGSWGQRTDSFTSGTLPSKPRSHYSQGRHDRYKSRNSTLSIESSSTGSARRYPREPQSNDVTGYDDTLQGKFPDASTMRPDDLFYPPGGSFQPYQAKYEPGCYKSNTSNYSRPRHPPSPPVRDYTADDSEYHDIQRQGDPAHRSFKQNDINRSSSMQNVSQTEDSLLRPNVTRGSRSASSRRYKDSSIANSDPAESDRTSARDYNHHSSSHGAVRGRTADRMRKHADYAPPKPERSQCNISSENKHTQSHNWYNGKQTQEQHNNRTIDRTPNQDKGNDVTEQSHTQLKDARTKSSSNMYSKPPKPHHSVHSHTSSNTRRAEAKSRDLPNINSCRLRTIRQKAKNSMVSILQNGEVCLEIVNSKTGKDIVTEVLCVSDNGNSIKIFSPTTKEQSGYILSKQPPIPPDSTNTYEKSTLPDKYHNKYKYLARFVQLVRSKTPKVTLFTKQAKCMLMENAPEADLEACFYNGAKVQQSKGKTMIIDQTGKLITLDSQDLRRLPLDQNCEAIANLTPEYQDMLTHALTSRQKALDIESAISVVEENSGNDSSYFPITVSRRPTNETTRTTNLTKTSLRDKPSTPTRSPEPVSTPRTPDSLPTPSIAPTTSPSAAPPIHFTESVLSYRSSATAMSRKRSVPKAPASSNGSSKNDHREHVFTPLADSNQVSKTLEVPGVGRASHLCTGDIWVMYNDRSQILMQSATTTVLYSHPSGRRERFGQSARLPEYVKAKLSDLPSIVEMLVQAARESPANSGSR